MGITMFGLTLGQSLMKGPGVSKLVGAGITGATAGFNYLMLLDEAVETHAAAAGKTVDDLSESELGNASFTAIQNAGLDFILPGIWARSMKKAGMPANKSLKELADNLKTTDKEKMNKSNIIFEGEAIEYCLSFSILNNEINMITYNDFNDLLDIKYLKYYFPFKYDDKSKEIEKAAH